MIDLTKKRALVCGSTQGIGKASAMALAKQGASITLIARNERTLQQTLQGLPSYSKQKHDYIVADFNQPEILKKSVESYLTGVNSFHILLNNSGGPPGGEMVSAKPEDFIQTSNLSKACFM
jgi:3-oxoacyl-[acyl-carrier protein] reductase